MGKLSAFLIVKLKGEMYMDIIKMLKQNETDLMGFRTYKPIELRDGISMEIRANSMSNCEPKADLPLERYNSVEVQFLKKDSKTGIESFLSNREIVNVLKDYQDKGSLTYSYVPLKYVQMVYDSVALEKDKENYISRVESMAKTDSIIEKIIDIISVLNQKFYEREDEIEGMILALLSKQHVLLIGDPGTGKSLLSMELSKIIDNSSYFQWLMTKYTTPEELFGSLSIKELEQGIHKRNTKGKLPEAELVFLDEIFKSNSAILNSLLTLINERLFYNNSAPVKSPLISLIGASNEYPEEDEGLEALFDRLLLRYEVKEIRDRNNYISMLKGKNDDLETPSLSLIELEIAQKQLLKVNVSEEIYATLADIVQALNDEGIRPSARRVKNSIQVLKAKAFINKRKDVILKDLLILEHILWNQIHEKEIAIQIIKEHAQDIVEKTLEDILNENKDIKRSFVELGTKDFDIIGEFSAKLKYLKRDIDNLKKNYPTRIDEIKVVEIAVEKTQKEITEAVLDPIEI